GYSCWYTICQKHRHTQPVDRFVVHHEEKTARGSEPAGGLSYSARAQLLEMNLVRMGLSTVKAMTAALKLRIDATQNTACQLPVADVSTLAKGTRREAVPFAVYSIP